MTSKIPLNCHNTSNYNVQTRSKRIDHFAQVPNQKGHTSQVQSEKPKRDRETKEKRERKLVGYMMIVRYAC